MKTIETMKDTLGRAYDAAKFLPRFDSLKRWVNRRAGRKPRNAPKKEITHMTTETPETTETPAPAADTTATPPAPAPEPPAGAAPAFDDIAAAANAPEPPPEAATPAAKDAGADAEVNTTAETIIGIIQTALVMIGEDEGVLSDPEKTLLRRPLQRVLDKYDITSEALPPEVDFAVALAMIVIARLKKPKTATTFVKFKTWLQNKLARRRGEKLAEKVAEATK